MSTQNLPRKGLVAKGNIGVRLAVHYMRKNAAAEKGSIICTASNAGIYAFPAAPMYGVAKHGAVGAIRSLGGPLSEEGIRINGICPNVIRTFKPFSAAAFPSSKTCRGWVLTENRNWFGHR